MKRLLLPVFFCAMTITNVFSQVHAVKDFVDTPVSFSDTKYWVYFTDKNNSKFTLEKPNEYLSQKSIERRAKMDIPLRVIDLPVSASYISLLQKAGVEIIVESRWLNAVSIRIKSDYQLGLISMLPFVKKIEYVKKYQSVDETLPLDNNSFYRYSELATNDYGGAYNQNHMIDIDFLHSLGYSGQGITIAVLDGGFYGVDIGEGFKSFWNKDQIIETRNFADDNDSVFHSTTHGSNVLSIMGGDMPGEYIGSAPDAKFYLFRTEVTSSETVVEEDYWVEGAEYADFVGADIINSSLGYTTFDDSLQDHTYEDLDGNTAVATIAADIAASVGILVCNSAGNEATSSWHFIGVPADGDSVFTIGAVDANENYATFSSVGPTADGRIKPNVSGQGAGTAYIDQTGKVLNGSGTSYSSPLIAGACASLWSAFPELTNMEIIDIVQQSSSQYNDPDYLLGYGIPSFAKAYIQLKELNISETNLLTIIPNPAESSATIIINGLETSDGVINVYDIAGHIIYTTEIKLSTGELSATTLINLDHLASGLYFVQLIGDVYSETKTLMVK